MQKKFAILVASAAAIALGSIAVPAQAQKFGTSHDTHCVAGNTAQACSLQNILNHYTVGGPQINTNNDSGYQMFSSTGGQASSSFLFSVAGFAPHNTFGLYKLGSPNTKVQLFGGGTQNGANVAVDFLANGAVKVGQQLINNFGTDFGFYLGGPGGTFFSQNALNGGNQQAMIYQGNGQTKLNFGGTAKLFSQDSFLVAFEDVRLGSSDRDYNDMVLMVSGIKGKAVPEPTVMLGLSAVAGAAIVSRRRRQG
jgi:hypothetical protein